jgi:hypothetical protein
MRPLILGRLLAILFIIFAATGVAAESPITLYRNYKSVNGYGQIVSELQPGDSVRFSSGATFELGPYRGAGGSTRIFSIQNLWAIRINKGGLRPDFLTGIQQVRDLGIPVIDIIYVDAGYEFVIVEDWPIETTAFELLLVAEKTDWSELNAHQVEMLRSLHSFLLKHFWNVTAQGSVRLDNIGIRERWRVVDAGEPMLLDWHKKPNTIVPRYEIKPEVPLTAAKQFYLRLDRAIRDKRRRIARCEAGLLGGTLNLFEQVSDRL